MLKDKTYMRKSGKMSKMASMAMRSKKDKKNPYDMDTVKKALKFMVTGKFE